MTYAISKTPKRRKKITLKNKNQKKGNIQGKYKVLMLRGSHKKIVLNPKKKEKITL